MSTTQFDEYKVWRNTRERNIAEIVGKFFQDIARVLSKGDRCEPELADVACWEIQTGLEVKAAGNDHSFRLPLEQLLRHSGKRRGFPFNKFCYFLFSYSNRTGAPVKGKRRSKLRKFKSRAAIHTTLVGSVRDLFILDIDFILAFLNTFGQKKYQFPGTLPGQPDNVVCLSRTALRRFLGASREEAFKEIGLNEQEWHVEKYEIELPVQVGVFPMTMRIMVSEISPKDPEPLFGYARQLARKTAQQSSVCVGPSSSVAA